MESETKEVALDAKHPRFITMIIYFYQREPTYQRLSMLQATDSTSPSEMSFKGTPVFMPPEVIRTIILSRNILCSSHEALVTTQQPKYQCSSIQHIFSMTPS
jgi:hypothetical protein